MLDQARKIVDDIQLRIAASEVVQIVLPPSHSTHWWPTFYMGADHNIHGIDPQPARQRLCEIMARLHYACSEPAGDEKYAPRGEVLTSARWRKRNHSNHWEGLKQKRLMTPEQVQLWRDLYDAIDEVIVTTFKNAKRSGHNVLLALATGELSVDKFNQATRAKSDDE